MTIPAPQGAFEVVLVLTLTDAATTAITKNRLYLFERFKCHECGLTTYHDLTFRQHVAEVVRILEMLTQYRCADLVSSPTPQSQVIQRVCQFVECVLAADINNVEWVILDWYETQVPIGIPTSYRDAHPDQISHITSFFVRNADAKEAGKAAAAMRKMNSMSFIDTNGHIDCCYAAEVGWTTHFCYHQQSELRPTELDGKVFDLVSTTEDYCWEGSLYDSSIGESVNATAPSAFVQRNSKLVIDQFGPSWRDRSTREVIGTYASDKVSGCSYHGFLVRRDWLDRFLKAHGVSVMYAGWYEKRLTAGMDTRLNPWVEGWTGGLLAAGHEPKDASHIRQEYTGRE